MAGSPEAKIRFLGFEVKPSRICASGMFLTLAGAWAGNEPCIAIPAIITGFSLAIYGARKIEEQDPKTPPL